MLKTTLLFFATALCEIIGCFLPRLWLKRGSVLLLIPASVALALFVWLLTLHPAASGRVYAAYGGVYVFTALLWLRVVDLRQAQRVRLGRRAGCPVRNADYCGGMGTGLIPRFCDR